MGSNLSSTPTPQNPPSAMSSISPNSPNPDLKTLENQNPDPNSTPNQTPEIPDQPTNPNEKGQDQSSGESGEQIGEQVDGDGDEEEGECGFCLFMKGGGCKDAFIAWENCVEEGEKNKQDIVERCFEVTSNLKKCMEAHSEYYEPILRAEKAADEEVKQELELEREAKKNDVEGSSESKGIEQTVEIEVEKQN